MFALNFSATGTFIIVVSWGRLFDHEIFLNVFLFRALLDSSCILKPKLSSPSSDEFTFWASKNNRILLLKPINQGIIKDFVGDNFHPVIERELGG